MGFAGRDFDNHKPLWLQTALRWRFNDFERYERWVKRADELEIDGMERRAAEKQAWDELAE